MIGVTNPNRPICYDCRDEYPEECMSFIIPGCCALCAIEHIAEQDADRALEFRALSIEWFASNVRNELADKYAALDDLDETTQIEADHLAKCDAREALFDAEYPYGRLA